MMGCPWQSVKESGKGEGERYSGEEREERSEEREGGGGNTYVPQLGPTS